MSPIERGVQDYPAYACYNAAMSPSDDKVKRRKCLPRISLRAVVVVIAVLCAYLACWTPTKRYAKSFDPRIEIKPVLPLVVSIRGLRNVSLIPPPTSRVAYTRYYLWLFGTVIRIPYESDEPPVPIRPGIRAQPFTKVYPADPPPTPTRQRGSGFSKEL